MILQLFHEIPDDSKYIEQQKNYFETLFINHHIIKIKYNLT